MPVSTRSKGKAGKRGAKTTRDSVSEKKAKRPDSGRPQADLGEVGLERDETYGHQRRRQLKELVTNTIIGMVTIYSGSYFPVDGGVWEDEPFPGLTGATRPDMTSLYFTYQEDMDEPEFSLAGVFNRISWECDEGKDPHGNGSHYSESNECSRGRRVLNAELRMHADDERFSDSSRAIVRFGCDHEADGFHLLNKSIMNNGWEKKMLGLYDDKDPEKKHRSERLLRAYVLELTHPERRDRYVPDRMGLKDKPVEVLDPESLEMLKEVAELPISAEEFHKESTEAFKIFREVINGDGVRGYASAILDIMPGLLELQKDDKVLVLINYPSNGRHTPPSRMMNGQKSSTHKTGENAPSVWWYDNADEVYDYEKRIQMEDGFTNHDPCGGGVALDRQ